MCWGSMSSSSGFQFRSLVMRHVEKERERYKNLKTSFN